MSDETYTALQGMIICVLVFGLAVAAIARYPDFFNGPLVVLTE